MRPVRLSIALLLLCAIMPSIAFGQAKAGIVTTLEGTATATRSIAPRPVLLKTKDDVLLRDRIETAERSFARVLLGGKAVVTIRERSAVTITEAPGLATIDIDSGKMGLAVARERMQPGELIEIRTPTAIVGVRARSSSPTWAAGRAAWAPASPSARPTS